MATKGIFGAFLQISEVLTALSGSFRPDLISISRFDYAFDFLLQDFELKPNNFVMHSKMLRHVDRETSEIGKSGRVSSIRIGKMPGQQVCVYDKREDVIHKRKTFWWDIWNANRNERGLSELSPSNSKGKIWRFELRAGKKFLNEICNIPSKDDFHNHAGSVLCRIAESVRFAIPTSDSNRSRWPSNTIWVDIIELLRSEITFAGSRLPESRVLSYTREEAIQYLEMQIVGCYASLAALIEINDIELIDLVAELNRRIESTIHLDPGRFRGRLSAAKERYFPIRPTVVP